MLSAYIIFEEHESMHVYIKIKQNFNVFLAQSFNSIYIILYMDTSHTCMHTTHTHIHNNKTKFF